MMYDIRIRVAALLMLGLALISTGARAQSSSDLEAFRNLPADQQQAVLESLGGQDGSGIRTDRSLQSPETVRARDVTDPATGRGATATSRAVPTAVGEPTIKSSDRLLLGVTVRREDPLTGLAPTADEATRLQADANRIQRGNPYSLDLSGSLLVPGANPIQLEGLTAAQAMERINADPNLRPFQIRLTLLPFESADLQPFGYDLFAGVPSTFAPVTDAPVPSEYMIGPGDRLEVQLIGSTKGRYSLVVNREGRVMFPELGPINVAGMRFEDAKARIETRVAEQMIGTEAVVSMGDLRSIRVFVLGEAERPGSYTVSGFATITNALFASGGVKRIGSLRNIQLKRGGTLVQRLDLYDLLLRGDTSSDVRLLPGDVIFIPPVGVTVGVSGEIRRPAIYELKDTGTAADLLYLAGGLTPEADPRLARIERIDDKRNRTVVSLSLSDPVARKTALQAGDVLWIPTSRPLLSGAVELKGAVFRPGAFQFRPGMRLTDLLPTADELQEQADLFYVLIRREDARTRRVTTISTDLARAWSAPESDANPQLAARDQVFVFDRETGRKQYLDPIVTELRQQATSSEPARVVRVSGQVRAQGEYPLDEGMTVSDLIRAAGGLAEPAFLGEAELARSEVRDDRSRYVAVHKINLESVLSGDAGADLPLAPFDTLVVKQIAEWTEQETVRLEGEVRFPGEYPIERGETLRSLLARAGGLTSLAFVDGSVFTRVSLQEREKKQMAVLAERLRQDLGMLALQASQAGGQTASQASETLAIGQGLLKDLETTEPVGRLVIDLGKVMAAHPGSNADVLLKGGDRLKVPRIAQEVTVIGEVQNATSHLYEPSLTRDDYVNRSGGLTSKADSKRIYVVRANGSVEAGNDGRWRRDRSPMQPGDTIVVPLDAERMRPLALWTSVTTILFNVAVAIAAVGSL